MRAFGGGSGKWAIAKKDEGNATNVDSNAQSKDKKQRISSLKGEG